MASARASPVLLRVRFEPRRVRGAGAMTHSALRSLCPPRSRTSRRTRRRPLSLTGQLVVGVGDVRLVRFATSIPPGLRAGRMGFISGRIR